MSTRDILCGQGKKMHKKWGMQIQLWQWGQDKGAGHGAGAGFVHCYAAQGCPLWKSWHPCHFEADIIHPPTQSSGRPQDATRRN